MINLGKYTEINHGCSKRIGEMISLKMSKAESIQLCKEAYIEKNGSDKGWSDRMAMKNDHLRSINSIETMRAAQKPFVDYMRSHGVTKFEKITREDVERYLVDRAEQKMPDGTIRERSAWTISRDLMYANKVILQAEHLKHEPQLSKAELGLRSRCLSQITRGRGDIIPSNRPGLEREREKMDIARGTGARRWSMTRITFDKFHYNEEGMPTSVTLTEKGGKTREAYILPAYQERIRDIIEPHIGSTEPIFNTYDRHINNHKLRSQYCKDILSQLQREHDAGEKYFRGEFSVQYKITDKEKEMFPHGFHGHPLIVAAQCSQVLGHNRIDVLKNYDY